jgi:hypothetical protein
VTRIDKTLGIVAVAAGCVLVAATALLPAEETLGDVIKLIFLHGALVRVGMVAFSVAGALGLACLFSRGPAPLRWCLAVQKTAVIVWVVYAVTSMFSTRLSWGEWIAWEEPRVQASIHVLWLSLACLALVLWVNTRTFTGLANLVVGVMAWVLVRGASLLRHPFNPIGESGSLQYPIYYWVMVAALLILATALAVWLERRGARRSSPAPAQLEPSGK